jgi:hypothetical protein
MDPSLQLRINICFPDSISFYSVDPVARDLLVISHWRKNSWEGLAKDILLAGNIEMGRLDPDSPGDEMPPFNVIGTRNALGG